MDKSTIILVALFVWAISLATIGGPNAWAPYNNYCKSIGFDHHYNGECRTVVDGEISFVDVECEQDLGEFLKSLVFIPLEEKANCYIKEAAT